LTTYFWRGGKFSPYITLKPEELELSKFTCEWTITLNFLRFCS